MSRLLLVAAVTLAAGLAHANGRFPATTNVEFHPSDPDTMLVPVTFGLLITDDGGETFHYVCEAAIGFGGVFDPDYAISPAGTLFATTFNGLQLSRDGGCTWQRVSDPPGDVFPGAVDVASDGDVWVAASLPMDNELYRSADDGVTFAGTGATRVGAVWVSLQSAPSSPDRVYASGYVAGDAAGDAGGGATVLLLRTDDDGGEWTALPTSGFAFGPEPRLHVEAVSPADADVVFARVRRAVPPNGDALYRSVDAGASWTRVLDVADEIRDVVVRAGGDDVIVATVFDGVHVSADGGATFSELADPPQMACAGESPGGDVFACGANWQPDCFALGRSTDATGWSEFLRFDDITAPLSCDPGTVQFDQCALVEWPMLVEQLGIGQSDPCVAGVVDAGAPDAVSAVDAGQGRGGGGDCGCSVAFAAMLLVWPRRRRRQYGVTSPV